jgi:putative membrane-bound dehydrogenase-like protein
MKSWPRWSSLALFLLTPAAALAQVAPDKAEATFTVAPSADGLEWSLWASEEQGFVNPTCMDIDHKGRVWVCESVNYRTTLHKKPLNRAEGDRIVILEDSKGTGKADKATTFYQSKESLAPLGIAVAKDPTGPGWKVFVCQSPDILVFEDKDGDGVADGPPKKLLTGFQGIDHDHGVHGILIGPDLKLYFSVGDQGVKDLQSSDGKGRKWTSNDTDCRAGTIWRCDLDGTNLELIAHNFRNEYEPCVDSFGTVFVSDNDDDGSQQTRICYVMPGGDYGYNPRGPGQTHWHEEQPGVVPKILRTYFGSPTGMCVYEGTLLPKKYWGQLLHVDAGPQQLRCYHLTANGAGYDVDREDMVTCTDKWFRPSDVCVAPDGSVFVADWYDPGVGGHGMGDTTRGRIYRLAPKGVKPSVPKVDLESKDGITAALASPNLATRYMAMAKIQSMDFEKVEPVLKAAVGQKENPWLRARALWQLGIINAKHVPGLVAFRELIDALEGGDPNAQILALRITVDLLNPKLEGADEKDVRRLANQTSMAFRRELLLALRNGDPVKSRQLILALARQYDGKDRFYLEAIGIAVGKHDKERRNAILADFEKEFPDWNDKVADLVWELRPPSVMPKLADRLADKGLTPDQRARIVDILAASDDKDAGAALLKVLSADVPAEVKSKAIDNLKLFLPGKWAGLRQGKELGDAVKGLLDKPETRVVGLQLIAVAEKTDAVADAMRLASDPQETEAVRIAAVQALGALPTEETPVGLERIFQKDAPASLKAEAAAALGRLAAQKSDRPGVAKALKALQTAFAKDDYDLAVRSAAASGLSASQPGTAWLIEQEEKKRLPESLRPDVARLLRNSQFPDLQKKALALFPPPGKIDPKKLPPIAVLATHKGNADHGKTLLVLSAKNDMQCLKCHTVRGVGGQIGPDLSVIGKKASRENLFESILYPSKAIADQYLTWKVETKQGVAVAGLIVEDTPAALTLRDANGKDTKIDKKDIDMREKSLVSLMPENIVSFMTEDDLTDMVEYLFTLKTPALAVDYWRIAGPFDNGDNDAGLDQVFPPEKGVDFNATYAGKKGKVTWRTVKPDATGYVDLQAFFAPDSNNIVSYVYREIDSPADQEATILLGTDDGCKLWLNDALVHTSRVHRAAMPEQDQVRVKLKKGKNTLLLKINNGDGAHGFYFTLTAEQEVKRVEEK